MTDIVKDLIILDRIPKRLFVPNRCLNLINLSNQTPNNAKKSKNDDVVKYTTVSFLIYSDLQEKVQLMSNTLFSLTFCQRT
jgi:hypothetical protein